VYLLCKSVVVVFPCRMPYFTCAFISNCVAEHDLQVVASAGVYIAKLSCIDYIAQCGFSLYQINGKLMLIVTQFCASSIIQPNPLVNASF